MTARAALATCKGSDRRGLPSARWWWAHLEFTRINIALTMVKKDIEETPPLRIPCDDLDLRAFQSGGSGGAVKFTVPIDGAIGPEPHPGFIEFSHRAPLGGGDREVAGAGEDGQERPRLAARPALPAPGQPVQSRLPLRPGASLQNGAQPLSCPRVRRGLLPGAFDTRGSSRRGFGPESRTPVPDPAGKSVATACP